MVDGSGVVGSARPGHDVGPGGREVSGGSTPTREPAGDVAGRHDETLAVAALGARVRLLRKTTGLTLEQLARKSGVSRAMLSHVERNEKSPTLPVVVKIARGLDVSLSHLMGAQEDPSAVSILRRADRLTYKDPETGFERQILSPQHQGDGVEVLLHRIPPGRSSGSLSVYSGPTHKYLVIQEGQLTVALEDGSHVLQAGDSICFEVTAPYRFINEGSTPCSYLMVVVRRG